MKSKISVLFAIIALIITSLACSVGVNEMSLENVRTAFDSSGNVPATIFSTEDVFFVVADLNNAPAGTIVESKWRALQTEGYNPGDLISEQVIDDFTDESFSGLIYFELSNDTSWPTGEYKADIYLNGRFIESVTLNVQ
ncbi:MAG: hypothetical protein QGM50_07970 [Anaerolineae bacterium]|nr:hypothetical protein [Anaerolineae bacterium]MDK1080264.1 hypothetical protein [Anaerolineae bacterium]MDK1118711.1 hypothetical protein [Anaerolineae bacterium]